MKFQFSSLRVCAVLAITRTLFMPDKKFAVVTFINAENAPHPLQNEIVLFAIDLYKDNL